MERDFLQMIQHHVAGPVILPALVHQQKSLLGLIAPGLGNANDPAVTGQSFPRSTTLADSCRDVEVVVAIGQAAAEASLEACTVPVLTVLMTRLQWHRLVENTRHHAVSAIDWEADPVLNLRLIRQLMPRAVKIGIFVSPYTNVWLPPLRREAKRLGMALVEMPVTTDEDAVRELRNRINGLDALLLLPESAIVNGWSLKPILLMSARHYLPTFGGLHARYVEAGVTAAVVADEDRWYEQIQTAIRRLAAGTVPPPATPAYTRTVINETVARTLSLPVAP